MLLISVAIRNRPNSNMTLSSNAKTKPIITAVKTLPNDIIWPKVVVQVIVFYGYFYELIATSSLYGTVYTVYRFTSFYVLKYFYVCVCANASGIFWFLSFLENVYYNGSMANISIAWCYNIHPFPINWSEQTKWNDDINGHTYTHTPIHSIYILCCLQHHFVLSKPKFCNYFRLRFIGVRV